MARIGGVISDMMEVASKLDTAGAETTTMTSSASTDAQILVDEVGDVTSRMLSQFGQHAEQLLGHISNGNRQLGVADWDGASKAAAVAAEADLNSQVNTTLSNATSAIGEFNTALVNQVIDFKSEIDSTFARVLEEIKQRYAELASGTATVAENFANADNMTYGG